MTFQDTKNKKEVLKASRVEKKSDQGWNENKIDLNLSSHLQLCKQDNRMLSSKFSGEILVNLVFLPNQAIKQM